MCEYIKSNLFESVVALSLCLYMGLILNWCWGFLALVLALLPKYMVEYNLMAWGEGRLPESFIRTLCFVVVLFVVVGVESLWEGRYNTASNLEVLLDKQGEYHEQMPNADGEFVARFKENGQKMENMQKDIKKFKVPFGLNVSAFFF